jgi:hypothetical protein
MGTTPIPSALRRYTVTATIRGRRRVQLEIMAADEEHVVETLSARPFRLIFDIDVSSIVPRDVADRAVQPSRDAQHRDPVASLIQGDCND